MRLVGLLLFLAPTTGAKFLADTVLKVNERLAEDTRKRNDKAMAA